MSCDVLPQPKHVLLNQVSPLLTRDSTLSSHNKLTIYKLLPLPILTHATRVWSNTSPSNYRHLQVLQSKCLRVIGFYPRRTAIPHLHSTLSLETIHEFIHRLTANFFHNCSTHPNPLVCQIGNYTLLDFHVQYRKYTGCNRRNVRDFGRVFLMLNYTDITPKHLYPKLNGYGDNGHRNVWASGVSTYCTPAHLDMVMQ